MRVTYGVLQDEVEGALSGEGRRLGAHPVVLGVVQRVAQLGRDDQLRDTAGGRGAVGRHEQRRVGVSGAHIIEIYTKCIYRMYIGLVGNDVASSDLSDGPGLHALERLLHPLHIAHDITDQRRSHQFVLEGLIRFWIDTFSLKGRF